MTTAWHTEARSGRGRREWGLLRGWFHVALSLPVAAAALWGPALQAQGNPDYSASEPPPPVYSLDECLAIGLREASAVRNAARDRLIADSTIRQVRAQVYPQVSADAGYTRMDRLDTVDFGEERVEIGRLDNYSLGIAARQLVYDGGGVNAALAAARDFGMIADHALERVRAETALRIRAQFADLLYLDAALEVNRQAVEQWEATLEQTEQRYGRDMASEFDVLNARVQLANALPAYQQARNRLAVARVAFADLLNLDDERYVLQGELHYTPFEEDLEALLAEAKAARPELGMARQGVLLSEADISVERSAYRPSVHLSARYGGQQSPMDFGGGSDLEWRWSATVQAQWSWLDGGLRRNRVQQKTLERDKAIEDLDALRRAVMLEVRQAWLTIGQASETVTATSGTVGLAEKSMEIATVRYRTGLITRLELADVQMALMRARLNHIEALRQYIHAVNAMRYAVGRE